MCHYTIEYTGHSSSGEVNILLERIFVNMFPIEVTLSMLKTNFLVQKTLFSSTLKIQSVQRKFTVYLHIIK
jgi:hypothetical protein